MFSDAFRFTIVILHIPTSIYREGNSLPHQQKVQDAYCYGRGVFLWTGIMHNTRTLFHICDGNKVTSQRYCTEILLDPVSLFRSADGQDFLFTDDNAHPHRTTEVSDTLAREDIQRMTWLTYSPDFNPIENAGDALDKRIA